VKTRIYGVFKGMMYLRKYCNIWQHHDMVFGDEHCSNDGKVVRFEDSSLACIFVSLLYHTTSSAADTRYLPRLKCCMEMKMTRFP